MIAETSKYGRVVRLSADFHIDTAQVHYTVQCDGCTFDFGGDFAPAANVYKKLSTRLAAGFIDVLLRNLVSAARDMGYTVRKAVA